MRKILLVLTLAIISLLAFIGCSQNPEHVHTFSAYWTHDSTHHWHAATCGHDVVSGKAEHSWDEGTITKEATHTTDGVKTYTCTVCSTTRAEAVPAKTDEHTFSTDWTSDATYHWHEPTCGHDVVSGKAEHTLNTKGICETCAYESNFKVDSNGVLSIIDKSLVTGDVTIPDVLGGIQVTAIGDSAFYQCSALTNVSLPSSVTSIGNYAFDGCAGLTEITIGPSVASIGRWAFSGCESLTSVTIPSSVESIGDDAFYYCTGLSEITIPSSVKTIGADAFNSCTGLKEITIPSTLTYLGPGTFGNCTGLTEITIQASFSSIIDYLFSGCTGLTSVSIPEGVTSIGSAAFYGCTGLTEITIPSTVTSIGSEAFSGCELLTEIAIPDSVTSIGDSAFFSCSGLTEISFSGSMSQWESMSQYSNWNYGVPAEVVHCTDGDLLI